MIYFAFGSNMDPEQMTARCPSHRVLGRGFLADHALCFPRRSPVRRCGTAGLAPAAGQGIWGVLYELDPSDLERLHQSEGYAPNRPADHNRHDFIEIDIRRDGPDGEPVSAFTYLARADDSGAAPSADYLRHLIEGAEYHGLPKTYVEMLKLIESGAVTS
jgi:hypothetical protein